MKDQILSLMHLPLPQRIGILLGLVGLTGFLFYYLILSPEYEDVVELKQDVESLELQVSKQKGIVANLPRYRQEVAKLDEELAKALRELPDKKSIENLLTQISDKARNAGLAVNLFQPAPERFKNFYAEIPVRLRVTGSYHQLASFFNEVGDLDRIVNLSEYQINLKDLGREKIILDSEITATSFRFLDESERLKVEGKKGKKKKRGRKR